VSYASDAQVCEYADLWHPNSPASAKHFRDVAILPGYNTPR